MEVKPGYKQTEVGVIPEDWDISRLGDLCQKIQDGTHFSPRIRGGDFLYVTSKNIGFGTLDVSDAERIDAEQHAAIYKRCDVRKNDLLLTKDGANTGNAALNTLSEPFSLLSSVAFLRFDEERHAPGYFLQQILSDTGQKKIKEAMSGNAITRLTLEKINNLRFIAPPVIEQRAIATALSDMDALLDGLDRLIAKKRAIKQAAMQQLLTAQTRLPGFSGEWEMKRLGDHLTFLKNGVNSRAELSYSEDVRYLHYGDIHGSSRVELSPANVEMPCLPRAKASRLDRLQNGDLIFADASEDMDGVGKSVEIQNAAGIELVSGLHTIAIRFDKSVLADGFKAYIQLIPKFRAHLRQLAAGTKVYATNRTHIASAELRLPGIDEQQAISALLTDMDAEITALETRRTKTRALKQAMMQELLTGRTRLV
ncbi:restriction endonuclease subunit S [Bordetella bronchiseptica]|uniref:restriction endonuclease subunit S n=1 Tax=Bordetella bronchiseptica TaxID=518 RepID=UPI0009B8754B|nr:restriction endonuclease subunit S [Bordetella bronchiseptica]